MKTLTPTQLLGPLNPVERQHAPERFYIAGDPAILETGARVSIVGSRQASPEGLARARKLARRLAGEGVVVVSGLALGIDTAAHIATIAAGGRTVGYTLDPVRYLAEQAKPLGLIKRPRKPPKQKAQAPLDFA